MQYSKSIAAIVGAAATVLLSFHIDVSTEVQAAIITLGTALAVALSPPNSPPA